MPTAARVRLATLSALYVAPYVVMLVWCWHIYKPRSIAACVLTAALGSLLLAGLTRTWRGFFLAAFPLLLFGIVYAAYTLSYGIVPGHTLAMILVSASLEELHGLWTVSSSKWLLVPLLAVLGLYLWLALRLPRWPIFAGKAYLAARVLLVSALPVTAYAAGNVPQMMDGIAVNPVVGSIMFFAGQIPYVRSEIRGAGIVKLPYRARRTSEAEEVHVLVVGESARRGNFSVYGYGRDTTPYLETLKNEAVFLQHTVADANLTSLAVPMILTGVAPENFRATPQRGSLLDLAKEAGYSTTWLVNQDMDITTWLGITPDHLELPPDAHADVFGRHLPDDVLLPAYRHELARSGAPRFIGMHIMESHWEYYLRYPAKFQRFGQPHKLNMMSVFLKGGTVFEDLTDAYDNSVLYTDWFLQQVIEAARALSVPATVTFIPDHGECLPSLDDGAGGHGGPKYHDSQFQIPAFVWMNDAYRAAHPERVATLKANAGKEIRSHDFFFTEADLMGISFPENNPERSFASSQFVPDVGGPQLVGGILATQR
jgi:glucan phosphoethanolaminetransferase (alkaline phosphatase superfamily)